jgi:AcrR family transcriptional regulator
MVEPQAIPDTSDSMHRHRLLEGMAQAVAAKGYAGTTIADIVAAAAVSRRTFYEHFATKADCLIALYEAASLNALKVLRGAIDPAHRWETQVGHAMTAYFGCLSQNPVLLRTLFVEILGLGAAGLAARRRVNRQIARFMLDVVNAEHNGKKRKAPLSPDMAMAVVGGINELVLQAIEEEEVHNLPKLADPAVRLVRAVTG